MSLLVKIMPEAEESLWRNAEWWARNRSVEEAERWYDGFIAAIESLSENPRRCPLARENDEVAHELRELHYGLGGHPTHRAIFIIRPDMILIVAIRHVSQADLTEDDLP